jgi:diguanylate cyclase (GGDEF)-like protein
MSANTCEMSVTSSRREQSLSKIEQLRTHGQLPSPKGVALAIMELCRREDVTTDDIARVVQTDPALTSRLLRLANSASTSGGRPVVSISDAILRLGLTSVRQVAMGFSLVDQYQTGPCAAFDYAHFWSHSLLMAVSMRALGALTRTGQPDELFACGLMARIGCLALATIHPVEYAQLLEKRASDNQLVELEREQLQADHNDFTVAIMCDIGIPKVLVEPVYHHEAPEQSGFTEGSRPYQLAHLVYHAKRLADMGLAPESERNGIISELMLLGGKLGLDSNDLGNLVDQVVKQWREWGDLLKVPAQALPTFAAMVSAPAPKTEVLPAFCPPLRVLLVEDDPTTRRMMEALLSSMVGREVYSAGNGKEAMALALEVMPQVVVTDWLMPVMDGLEFCSALRATDWGQSMYVIMLTGVDAEEEIVHAFEAGVDDYVTKPVNVRALRARMRAALHYVQLLEAWERDRAQLKQFAAELAITNRKLEHYALTDLLTGLPNRRAGIERLHQAWSAAKRFGQALAVMMVDIDRFKGVNDTHGHAVGDKVLTEIGRLIQATARKDDYVCRIGGEEFLVICQNTELKSTLQAAERVRKKVKGTKVIAGEVELQITLSIGVACKEVSIADADSLVIAADRALYAAKEGGRDRTCLTAGGKLLCKSG